MQHINNFSSGMKSGIDYSLMPQDSYSYMLNGYLVSKDEHGFVITGIKGNVSIANFSVDECPIGSTTFNGILYIITHKRFTDSSLNEVRFYSLKGSNGSGWIDSLAILPRTTTGLVILSSVIGFSRNKLIEVFAKESYDGSVDLYLCDGLNQNLIINTGIDSKGVYTGRSYSVLNDKSLFLNQKNINKIPDSNFKVLQNGNIKPGTYFIYIRYEDESLNPTPFIKEVGPIFIHSGSSISNNSSGVLNEKDYRVNKKILLSITNADINYKKVSIGIVYYYGFNGILSRENYLLNKSYSLSNGSTKIIIDGDNEVRSLLLEELISDGLRFDSCETQEQFDGRFYGAKWKSKDVDLKKLSEIAKLIIPHAVIKDYSQLDYDDNFEQVCDENTKEFEYMEEEIYPFGVSFLIDGQYKTEVFPIFGWYESNTKQNINVVSVPEAPTITVDYAQNIIGSTANVSGNVLSIDNVDILEKGIIWKIGSEPTMIDHDGITEHGAGVGTFNSSLTNLVSLSSYYYKSYAKIEGGTYIYSDVKLFATFGGFATVDIALVEYSMNSAVVKTNFITDDGWQIINRGTCWSLNHNPTLQDNYLLKGQGTTNFITDITALAPNTKYYVRNFVINDVNIYYSEEIEFTTFASNIDIYIKPTTSNGYIYLNTFDVNDQTKNVLGDIVVLMQYDIIDGESNLTTEITILSGRSVASGSINGVATNLQVNDINPSVFHNYVYHYIL